MPDLLLELLSEEIPARMQGRAAEDLRRLVTDALVAKGLLYEGAVSHATPRRLVLHVAGLPAKGQDLREEKRGPRVGAPEAAVKGFLKSAGVTGAEQVRVVSDPKKGDYYLATIERPGRPTPAVLSDILPGIIRSFPWPKSMRWGAASREPGSLRWVRPLQSVLCTFGTEVEGAEVVPLEIGGVMAGDATRGHRFMAPDPIRVRHYDAYVAALDAARVVVDAGRRRDIIRHDARDLAFAQGLEVVEDEALLDEVAGLVEWPVVLMGSFDESFLVIPPEVIRATIRANQKCFVLRGPSPAGFLSPQSGERSSAPAGAPGEGQVRPVGDGAPHPVALPSDSTSPRARGEEARREGGALANRFILVSNLLASDGGDAIVAGNERVVRARLSDARFFWDTDRRTRLEDRLPRLNDIVFHEKLGTQFARVERIAALAREFAPVVGADPDLAERAARLAKADLVTEMVGEFPELQGLMGRYYAAAEGEHPSVAAAIEDHYRPAGPSDRIPTDPVAVAVGLADKLDTLAGFWAIDETPTGSKDPYALRRAALGVIRIVLENELRLRIEAWVEWAIQNGFRQTGTPWALVDSHLVPADLLAFFHDRLKVYLRDRGARHDLIDAVLGAGTQPPHAEVAGGAGPRSTQDGGASLEAGPPAPPDSPAPQDEDGGGSARIANDDLLLVVRRVEALGRFLDTEDGRNLLAATRRAANILRIEEKKDGRSFDGMPDLGALALPEEKALAAALAKAAGTAADAVAREAFEEAMRALAELRPAVDAFFDEVTVNAPEPALRENRLRLLAMLRRATREVADFGLIAG